MVRVTLGLGRGRRSTVTRELSHNKTVEREIGRRRDEQDHGRKDWKWRLDTIYVEISRIILIH